MALRQDHKVTIYDKDGNEFSRFTVDAREAVDSGEYFNENPKAKKRSRGKKAVEEVVETPESTEGSEEGSESGEGDTGEGEDTSEKVEDAVEVTRKRKK